MRFKYPQFFVLLVFIVPMLACSSFFGSSDGTENSSSTESQSADADSAESSESEPNEAGSDNGQEASSDSEPAANQPVDSSSTETVSSISPSLPNDTDDLPFQTYRSVFEFTTTSGEDVASMQMVNQRDIPNQSTSYEVSGIGMPDMEELGGDSISFAIVEGTAYFPFDGECMAMATDSGTPFDDLLEGGADFFSEDELQVSFVGDGMELGLPVKIYAVTELVAPEFSDVEGNVSVYTSPSGKELVLKAEMRGRSETNPLTEAAVETEISYIFEVTDVDTELNIPIPDGCENAMQMPNLGALVPDAATVGGAVGGAEGEASGGFPAYPGSTLVSNVVGIQTFLVPQSAIDEASVSPKEFFMQAFAELGYTSGDEIEAGSTTTLAFQGDGETVQLIIAEDGDTTTVTIMALP